MLFKEGLQGIEEKVLRVHGTRCNLPILALCGRRCHLGTVDCDQGPPGKRAMASGAQERTDVQSTTHVLVFFMVFFFIYFNSLRLKTIMIAHIALLAMVGNMVAINDAGRNPHPLLNKYHARTSSSSGNAFLLNDGARGERYNERKYESGAEMCPPPAQLVFEGQHKWCICSGGSTCKGMECYADKWDPEKVSCLLFFSFFF